MAQRSTKGASKQRRDAINDKIGQIRELLPVSEAVRCRLSQLQVMAMINAYITKSNFFADYCYDIDDRSASLNEHFDDVTQSLPGFLIMANVDGRILYISDNISEYLGNSSVDSVTQLESIYDVIDEKDRAVLRQAMAQHQQHHHFATTTSDDDMAWTQTVHGGFNQRDSTLNQLSFTCRMNTTARGVRNMAAPLCGKTGFERHKTMQVRGKFLQPRSLSYAARMSYSNPHLTTVFVALCTPHLAVPYSSMMTSSCIDMTESSETDTMTFRSLHHLDMKFLQIDANGEHHLDYNSRTIFGKSWYELIHPEDIEDAKYKHMQLVAACEIGDMTSSKSLCLRVQTGSGRFLWLHVIMRIHGNNNSPLPADDYVTGHAHQQATIVCTNHVIDEVAALYLRLQEVEIPLSGADDGVVYPTDERMMYSSSVPLPLFVDTMTSSSTSQRSSEDREEVTQRLKRKINDRRMEQQQKNGDDINCDTAVHPPSKMSRMMNDMVMINSMPSPPLQHWDDYTIMTGHTAFDQSANGQSHMPAYNFEPYAMSSSSYTVNNMMSDVVPDSFLTPSSSPALQQVTATAESNDIEEWLLTPADDCSFFCGLQQPVMEKTSMSCSQQGCWNSESGASEVAQHLPELDHRSIASLLGDSDLSTPVSVQAPPSGFISQQYSAKTTPTACRQQLTGGHVMVVNNDALMTTGQQLYDTGDQEQLLQTDVMEQLLGNEELISNLLALGGDFLQSLQLDPTQMMIPANNSNQFYPHETSVFGY